jgi:hypothetical protein
MPRGRPSRIWRCSTSGRCSAGTTRSPTKRRSARICVAAMTRSCSRTAPRRLRRTHGCTFANSWSRAAGSSSCTTPSSATRTPTGSGTARHGQSHQRRPSGLDQRLPGGARRLHPDWTRPGVASQSVVPGAREERGALRDEAAGVAARDGTCRRSIPGRSRTPKRAGTNTKVGRWVTSI